MSSPESLPRDSVSPQSEASLFGDSDQEAPQERRVKRARLPRYSRSYGAAPTYFTRIPAFINIEPAQFSSQEFLEQLREQPELVENTVRWKYGRTASGEMVRLSNARIVEWSDGTRTLQLGGEQFELRLQKPFDTTFVAVAHSSDGVLQTRALVDDNMTIIPTSTASATHKRLASTLARRQSDRQSHIGSVATTEDPEKVQRDIERAEQAKEKARKKLEAKRAEVVGASAYTAPLQRSREIEDDGDGDGEDDEEDDEAYGSDDLDALDDDAEEANASRLNAAKKDDGESTGDDEEKTNDEKPLRRTRVLDDDSD